ncbi:hypothetical protein QR685DRAFT_538987 [Neurospora intermedia]|uniref:Uncharacterized protein n=1 Tax=Neurospora intermedia TaxID=5142 RepID=A0ABR3CXR5_NEUIN
MDQISSRHLLRPANQTAESRSMLLFVNQDGDQDEDVAQRHHYHQTVRLNLVCCSQMSCLCHYAIAVQHRACDEPHCSAALVALLSAFSGTLLDRATSVPANTSATLYHQKDYTRLRSTQ